MLDDAISPFVLVNIPLQYCHKITLALVAITAVELFSIIQPYHLPTTDKENLKFSQKCLMNAINLCNMSYSLIVIPRVHDSYPNNYYTLNLLSKKLWLYSSECTIGCLWDTTDPRTISKALRPYLVSMLYLLRSRDSVARRSPCVSAPKLSSLFATTEANRCSPASSEMRKTYSGADTWLERWVRPITQTTNPYDININA